MTINWAATAVYNTIMSVSAGVGLLLIVKFGSDLMKAKISRLEGWVIGFAIPGFILTVTGLHMSLTWPLAEIGFPYDDIIFGEPSLAFGVLLLAVSALLRRKSNLYFQQGRDMSNAEIISSTLKSDLTYSLKPLSYFAAAMGLALISIAIAGIIFRLFAAPPQEPITGAFADFPLVEAIFISSLYALTGFGAVLFPFIIKEKPSLFLIKTIKYCWLITGSLFVLFGAMNYFTHIGLIVHTLGG